MRSHAPAASLLLIIQAGRFYESLLSGVYTSVASSRPPPGGSTWFLESSSAAVATAAGEAGPRDSHITEVCLDTWLYPGNYSLATAEPWKMGVGCPSLWLASMTGQDDLIGCEEAQI